MTPSEKRRATIIDKYGSWEAYVEQRYLNPKHAESRRERSRIAGSVKSSRKGFGSNPELARKAGSVKSPTKGFGSTKRREEVER